MSDDMWICCWVWGKSIYRENTSSTRWAFTIVLSRVFLTLWFMANKITVLHYQVKKKLHYRGNSTYNLFFPGPTLYRPNKSCFFSLISEFKWIFGSVWDFWIRASRRHGNWREISSWLFVCMFVGLCLIEVCCWGWPSSYWQTERELRRKHNWAMKVC